MIAFSPYEGNEHLVGSDQNPEEEVRLEEGEWLVCSDDNRFINIYKPIVKFIGIEDNSFKSQGTYEIFEFAIRFKDFDPSNMKETKKHILCVKDGKIIRYKG